MTTATRWVIASGNAHKVEEIREFIERSGLAAEIVGVRSFGDAPNIDETADTFVGNATLKAQGVASWLAARAEPPGTWVLADDSGLCVEALGGGPGVRSARFAGPTATDAENNEALVRVMQALGLSRSRAYYTCALVCVRVDGTGIDRFEAHWPVEVRIDARGAGGFGYDPHAWVENGRRTVAELSRAEKDLVSHRGQALRAWATAMCARP